MSRLGLSHSVYGQGALKHPATGTIGLQLYSLRHLFEKGDVPGTLAMVRGWGFTDVEAAGTYKLPVSDFAAQVKKAGLRITSTGADFNALAKDAGSVIKDARELGAQQVMCAWIPHEGRFSRADVDKAVPVFSKVGRAMRDAGLRFLYHVHGYEFQQGPDGTLFDALAKQTEPGVVDFQMDVFWVVHGGGNPVELFAKYPGRFPSTHLKDMRKGTKINEPTGDAPDDTSVVARRRDGGHSRDPARGEQGGSESPLHRGRAPAVREADSAFARVSRVVETVGDTEIGSRVS